MKTRTLFVLLREGLISMPPIGPLYVSAYLKREGFTVISLNLNMRSGSIEEILSDYIKKYDINVIATGGLCTNYFHIDEIVTTAKKICPNIITVTGGGIITGDPETMMRGIPAIDYGIIGEGEMTFAELLSKIENCAENETNPNIQILKTIDGLIFRDGDSLFKTPLRKDIEDLDSLPFPDYDAFEIFEYLDSIATKLNGKTVRSGIITTARSCSNRCTFCSASGGKRYRQRSMNNIFKEIDMLLQKYQITALVIIDELFSSDRERIIEFCQRVQKHKLKWHITLRADCPLNADVLSLMKQSGCTNIMFGAESMDDSVLKSMRKNATAAQNENSLFLIHKSGIHASTNFIFGDVVETAETAEKTLSWWLEHREYDINMYPISLYPGSKLYKDACKCGKIADPLEHIKKGYPLVNVSKMTDDQYYGLFKRIDILIKEDFKVSHPHKIIKDNIMRYSYDCEQCGANNVNILNSLNLRYARCANCGRNHRINIILYNKKIIRNGFVSLIQRGKTAVWGCGRLAMNLFDDALTADDIKNLTLIDQSPSKQGLYIKESIINAPSILEDDDFKNVVFMGQTPYLFGVRQFVDKNYPHIDNIIDGNKMFHYF
jgi:radical SAM superfamily enzyme YgiQ (UPF0313 family)